MDFTHELSKAFNLSPFDVLKQDKDYVIMLINYFIEKGQNTNYTEQTSAIPSKPKGDKRVRVNDKTATGGWF